LKHGGRGGFFYPRQDLEMEAFGGLRPKWPTLNEKPMPKLLSIQLIKAGARMDDWLIDH
jgi:hypothetical protein